MPQVNYRHTPFRIDLYDASGALTYSILEGNVPNADNLISAEGLQFTSGNDLEFGQRNTESASFTIRSLTPPSALAPLDSTSNPNTYRSGNKVELYYDTSVTPGTPIWALFATLYMSDQFTNDDGSREATTGRAPLESPSITIRCNDRLTNTSAGASQPNDDTGMTVGVETPVLDVLNNKLQLFLKDPTFTLGVGEPFAYTTTAPIIQTGESLASVPTTVSNILYSNPNNDFEILYLSHRPSGDIAIAAASLDPASFLFDEDVLSSDLIKDALPNQSQTEDIPGTIDVDGVFQTTQRLLPREVRGPFFQYGPINLPVNLGPEEDYNVQLTGPNFPVKQIDYTEIIRQFGGPGNAYVNQLNVVERTLEPTGYVYADSKTTSELLEDLDSNIRTRVTSITPMTSTIKETIQIYNTTFPDSPNSPPALTSDAIINFVSAVKIDTPTTAQDILELPDITQSQSGSQLTTFFYTPEQKIEQQIKQNSVAKGIDAKQRGLELEDSDNPFTSVDSAFSRENWIAEPKSEAYTHTFSETDYLNDSRNISQGVPADDALPPATKFAPSAYEIIDNKVSCPFDFTDETGTISPLTETLQLGNTILSMDNCERVALAYATTLSGQNNIKVFNVAINPTILGDLRPASGNPLRNCRIKDRDYYTKVYLIKSHSLIFSRQTSILTLTCLQLGFTPGLPGPSGPTDSSPISPPTSPIDSVTPFPGPINLIAKTYRRPSYLLLQDGSYLLNETGGGILLER